MAVSFPPKVHDPSAPNDPEVEAAFQQVPETMIAEIIDGEVFVNPRPAPPHVVVASELGGELHAPYRHGRGGPGGWAFRHEPELHLGPKPDKLVPDLAGWRLERAPERPGGPSFYDLAPDWVCEVLSPSTEANDRGKKMRIYRREGVGHLWLIHPQAQQLEVYRLESGRWVQLETYEGDVVVRAEPFEAIELNLSILWGPFNAPAG